MRIAVVGTSNSLMKYGYAYSLSNSPRVTSFKNMSIGKSVSLLFSLTTDGVDFSEFDFCIFDFAVNEEIFVRHGISHEAMRDFTLSLAARVWKAGCIPVMLMLPRQSVLIHQSKIREHCLSIAHELNAPFFDVISYVERLEQERSIARKEFFQDDGHLAEWFALGIGHQLLESLFLLKNMPRSSCFQPWSSFSYRPFAMVQSRHINVPVVPRRNSLFQIDFAGLRPGNLLRISAAKGEVVAGLYVNLATTAGFLRISGATTQIIDLRNAYQRGGRETFVLSTVALQNTVSELNEMISIEVVLNDEIDDKARDTVLVGIPEREKPVDLGYVELGGLIVRSAIREETSTCPPPNLHMDIARSVSPAAVDTAISMYASHTVTPKRKA